MDDCWMELKNQLMSNSVDQGRTNRQKAVSLDCDTSTGIEVETEDAMFANEQADQLVLACSRVRIETHVHLCEKE